jgi:hypothetical protein
MADAIKGVPPPRAHTHAHTRASTRICRRYTRKRALSITLSVDKQHYYAVYYYYQRAGGSISMHRQVMCNLHPRGECAILLGSARDPFSHPAPASCGGAHVCARV